MEIKKEFVRDGLVGSKEYKYTFFAEGTQIGEAYVIDEVDKDRAYLENIDIYEPFQNKGYGTTAIKSIASEYWELYLAPTNEDNQRLYERLGEDGYDVEVDQGYGVYLID